MSKEKIKEYLYTRVSTAMQIDGYKDSDRDYEVTRSDIRILKQIV